MGYFDGKPALILQAVLSVFSKGFTYIFLLVVANLFTQEAYGEAKFIMSIFFTITALAFLGLPSSVVPFYVKHKDKMSTVFYFFLGIIFICFLISFFLFDEIYLLLLVVAGGFLLLERFFMGILQAKQKHHMYQFIATLNQVLLLVFVLFMIGKGAGGIVTSYALAFIVVSMGTMFFMRKEFLELARLNFDGKFLAEYMKYGLTATVIISSSMFMGWMDASILGLFSGFRDVALYGIADSVANILTMIPVALMMFMITRAAETKKGSNLQKSVLKRVTRISLVFSISGAILLASFMPLITRLMFPSYQGLTETYAIILLSGIFFASIYSIAYSFYAGRIELGKMVAPIIAASLLNILLDILLIPTFGVLGITVATFAAHMLAFTWIMAKANLLREFWPAYFLVLLIPSAYLLGYYGLVLLVFLPVIYLAGMIKKGDIEVVAGTLKKFLLF